MHLVACYVNPRTMRVEYVNEGESELTDNEENKAKGNRIGRMGRNQDLESYSERCIPLLWNLRRGTRSHGTPVFPFA